jgi:hypothetical protein
MPEVRQVDTALLYALVYMIDSGELEFNGTHRNASARRGLVEEQRARQCLHIRLSPFR